MKHFEPLTFCIKWSSLLNRWKRRLQELFQSIKVVCQSIMYLMLKS